MTPRLRPALALAAVLALTGCTGDTGDTGTERVAATPTPTASGPRVLQPGLPGEPVTEVTDPTPAPPPAHSDADVAFARGMVVHHAQALEMAALAPDRAASERLRLLAERIAAAQGPEIAFMGQWLSDREELDPATAEVVAATTDRDIPPSDVDHGAHGGGHGGAGHDQHPGMATDAEMADLRAARGAAFDRLFLTLMIRHHEGALQMVEQRANDGGSDQQMEELAADVGATQSVEIDRMRELLRGA